jgi:hypothetical protein
LRIATTPVPGTASNETQENGIREDAMLWTLFVVLLVLWLLGIVSGYALGGFVHVLLVLAVVALIVQLLGSDRHNEV